VTLELGGNDPAIVLPDVEPADVAKKIFRGAMFNTGQVCVAIKRVFVHESQYEKMVDAMADEAAKAKAVMNDGLADNVMYGPINNKMQVSHAGPGVSAPHGPRCFLPGADDTACLRARVLT
jgi:acyl-CoA reductase-like NAD-dependent aldehyde dehydrogenase